MDEFRALLRARLNERGALARLSENSGIASHVLGRWRDGIGRPTDTNLRRLAPALGVPYVDLAKMCDYLPGEPSADLNPQLASLIAHVEAGWSAMDEPTREVAERGTRALFAHRAATNASGTATVNHTDRRVNDRRGRQSPPLPNPNRALLDKLLPIFASLSMHSLSMLPAAIG